LQFSINYLTNKKFNEKKFLSSLVSNELNVFDVGSNLGSYIKFVSNQNKDRIINFYSFEPNGDLIEYQKKIKLSNLHKLNINNIGVSNENIVKPFFKRSVSSQSSFLEESQSKVFNNIEETLSVKTIRLDDFCIENNIDYYYIDTGYFGNLLTKKWHRIAKNNLQTLDHKSTNEVYHNLFGYKTKEIDSAKKFQKSKKDRPFHPKEVSHFNKRFDGMGLGARENQKYVRRDRSNRILLVPPSQKVFNHFGGDAKEWTDKFLFEAKKYTNKEIVLRPKVSRSDRLKFSVQTQLVKEGFDSLITFNSIASLEAIIKGFPATTLGPNAGSYLSNTDIKNIDNVVYPKEYEIKDHLFYLSLCQFTVEEIASGWAFRVINTLQYDQKPNRFKL